MTDVTGNLRASDDDREAVSERLRVAAGDGRISLEELEERLERAYHAKTYAELDALIADLPAGAVVSVAEEPLILQTRSGNLQQVGAWVVPRNITASCTTGTIKIDFTRAACHHHEVMLDATCGAGTIVVIVPRGWTVRLENVTTGMGSVVNKANAPSSAGLPLLRVTGKAGLGTIKFKHPRR